MDRGVSGCTEGRQNSLRDACWMGHPIHGGKLLPMEDKPVLEPFSMGNTFVLHRA